MADEPVPPSAWRTTVSESPNGEVTWLGQYGARPVRFIEAPLLQAATFHVLAGMPKIGKGLITTRWAARCTNGEMFGRPRRVVWATTEDHPELDLVPRLEAAGGDPKRVALIPESFRLPRDLEWLTGHLSLVSDVGLIIIDPLSSYISGVDSNMEEQVRGAVGGLNAIAAAMTDGAVVGIRHASTKDHRGGGFVSRVLGSTAWVALPRAVVGAAREGDVLHARTLQGNRVPDEEAGTRFRIVSARREPEEEWPYGVPLALDDGVSNADLDQLVSGREEGGKAKRAQAEIIRVLYRAGGRQLSDLVDTEVALAVGCSARTVRNQRKAMKDWGWLSAYPEREPGGAVERWHVALTNSAPSAGDAEEAVKDPTSYSRARAIREREDSSSMQEVSEPLGFWSPEPEAQMRAIGSSAPSPEAQAGPLVDPESILEFDLSAPDSDPAEGEA